MRADRGPLALLGIALGLGSLADLMLRTSPAGLNAAVVTVALTLAIAATRSAPGGTPRLPLAVAAVAIGLAFCWRDSPVLKGLDLLAAVVVLGLLASPRRQGPSLSGHAWSVGRTSAYTAAGPIPALAEVSWADVPRPDLDRGDDGPACAGCCWPRPSSPCSRCCWPARTRSSRWSCAAS